MKHREQQHGLSEHSFRQKVQHLGPAPGHPERQRCVLLRPERGTLGQTGLHLCSISLVGRWGSRVGGPVTRANLESFGRRIRRAVRHEGNEGKGNGRRWIKKRRERGQGRSASLVDVAMNDKETKNHNFNTGIKWRGINSLSWLLLVSIKCWFQCVKDEKIRKTQLILLFQRLLSFGPRTNPYSETHIITVVSLADWSYSEENLKCYFVITLEHMFVIKNF